MSGGSHLPGTCSICGNPTTRRTYKTCANHTAEERSIHLMPNGRPLLPRVLTAPAVAVPPSEAGVRHTLRSGPQNLDQLATALRTTKGVILDILTEMRQRGINVQEAGGFWALESLPPTGGVSERVLRSDADGWYKIGALGDTHLCSKQERLAELRDMYRIYEANGISTVLHTGNYIDGEARFNKYELKVHGMDNQLVYMGEQYPRIDGIETLLISGDDHEGWYGQREGVDIGRYMESVMVRSGRTDLINMGYMESFLPMEHATSGKRSMLHMIHPGGGSAYATSYTVQKLIESYEGGSKPAIALVGHYHKAEHLETRNVHAFQTGCFQDQTIFARKKRLTFTIGGWILMFRQNAETGAIEEVVSYFKSYFDRGYYTQNRWSLSGPVSLVPRLAL